MMYPVAQLLGLPPCTLDEADAVVLPLPLEHTVSYGPGTAGGPAAILDASRQIETFDEQTRVDFEAVPRIHTAVTWMPSGCLEADLAAIQSTVESLPAKLLLSLGGEHTLTLSTVNGLCKALERLTIVHLDAHADLIDQLDGRKVCHGTVMRRLWERGVNLVQIGVRSVSREEFELIEAGERIETFFAYRLHEQFEAVLDRLRCLAGDVYLSLDIDALDPGVVPSTGTPQPGGLSWRQTMAVLEAVTAAPRARLLGADLVEFVPSPHAPGCDLSAAKLAVKLLAWWWRAGHRNPNYS